MSEPSGHIVIAPDKFKGSLTGAEVAARVAAGLRRSDPEVAVVALPVADGGDGTVDAVVACGFERVEVQVTGPVGEPVQAAYAWHPSGTAAGPDPSGPAGPGVPTAVIELAEASGLRRLPPAETPAEVPAGVPAGSTPAGTSSGETPGSPGPAGPAAHGGVRLAPLTATSRGTGELIAHAVRRGARRIVLGLGGSACTDGGAGMMAALGVRFLDADGRELPPGGAALRDLARIDTSGLVPLDGVEFVVACDVDNPLLGPYGAAAVYAPQKGATGEEVRLLEAALARLAAVAAHTHGLTGAIEHDGVVRPMGVAAQPGAGAAGGVGFAAVAFLRADIRPGIEYLLDLLGFRRRLGGARLVVTGEGSLDEQTLRGKAPAGVAAAAGLAGVPVVAVCGRRALGDDELHRAGIRAAYALTDVEPDPERCMAEAGPLLERLTAKLAADWL
ncbi:glycerate kinase [Planomonospora parontospora subsp. parontospora]|uniref:Glycerate kinase n=2 Tax=Planomonospora parontospora TaxID=58119 RepID=A0AA37BC00_9ACTN|nr:glycerate kinase [Planomonospora parontospora]GGK47083.1 glycerate kinase [Planomonospora parontospora]GII06559.1 glycerate kinase [Planomonospora parontospora subsp. parontospora]